MAESKRLTLSPGKDGVVDRISNLPESLLCHILSFLPTKDSIATSILSTRWKLLWTLVPKLDLDSDTIGTSELSADDDDDDEDERDIMFAHVVSSVLAQQECGELQTFRLQWKFGWDGSHLDAWLRTAAARKVKELDLDILVIDMDVENLKLPPSFFSCRTLVVLKLTGTIDIDIDTPSLSFNFPSLKILHLVEILFPSVIYSQERSFLRFLSGCPVLEDLSFTTDDLEGEYKVCVPTLKRFIIRDLNGSDYELEINAPALEYFDFCGDLRVIKFYEKLNNLVQANVGLYVYENEHKEFFRERVFRLFTALNNVKFLSFSPDGTEWHNVGNICPSSFQNLVQLDFKVTDCNWSVLQYLLQNAPNLESLVVTKGYAVKSNLCRKELQYDRDYLSSHLTSFYYGGFEGLKDEEEFVKYILKEARVLKTATIQVYRGKSKENVLEKLSMFPRRSTTCLLRVE
ncbi:hypothetical protein ACB092_06G091300 [Castanea dentata]